MSHCSRLNRSAVAAASSLTLAIALSSCSEGGDNEAIPGGAGSSGKSGGAPVASAGAPGSGAAASGGSSGSGTNPSGGAAGSVSSGAAAGVGGSSSGAGGSAPVCSNEQHPEHLDKDCSIWAEWDATKGPDEPKDCDAEWLTGSGYCLESCGKCESGGGSGGSDGAGGNTSSGGNTGSGGTGLGPGPDLPDVNAGQVYWASRYWDCCKPHCAWQGMPSCGEDGISADDGDSACGGGSAYACYNQAPRALGDNVSYGYVAVPNPSCGTCYHLQFTGTGHHTQGDPGSVAIGGKHMIVKVINTGGDVAGNQFDIMIPGGGVGINPNTCPDQWNVDAGALGPPGGGFLASCAGDYEQKKECVRQKCSLIPAGDARDGCFWFVDWMQIADNPQFRYEPIDCPSDF